MASKWKILKASIANVIKTNGNQEITGAVLQNTLNSIVNSVGENATFADIATPSTNPGVPDGPVFYIANTPGIYSNFNGITVNDAPAILVWNGQLWQNKKIGNSDNFGTIVDLGLVDSQSVAFSKAAEDSVINNTRVAIICWRTSNDSNRGNGGIIFQTRWGNYYILQSMPFGGMNPRGYYVRAITTGGNKQVGEWEEVKLPVSFAYNASTRQASAIGPKHTAGGGDQDVWPMFTLPLVSGTQAGLMSANDKKALTDWSITISEHTESNFELTIKPLVGGAAPTHLNIPMVTEASCGLMSVQIWENLYGAANGSVRFHDEHLLINFPNYVDAEDLGSSLEIPVATTEHNGLMGTGDKVTLNEVRDFCNNFNFEFSDADENGVTLESCGEAVYLPPASTTLAGCMSANDKAALSEVKNFYDNFNFEVSAADEDGVFLECSGETAYLAPASEAEAGMMSAADKRTFDTLPSKIKDAELAHLIARWRAAWQRKVFGWKKAIEYNYGDYDPETGMFYANDRHDITPAMAEQILRHANPWPLRQTECANAYFGICDGSLELPPVRVANTENSTNVGVLGDCTGMFRNCGAYIEGAQRDTTMEGAWTIRFVSEQWGALQSVVPTSVTAMFYYSPALKEIVTPIDMKNITNAWGMFYYNPRLQEVKLKNLKCNIDLVLNANWAEDSLSLESFQYLVENAANTTPITVKLTPPTYAKLIDETNTEWHAVLIAATAKQIAFASA